MKQFLLCATLLLSGMCLGQQGQPPPEQQRPPYQTPPTFPEGRQAPGQAPGQTMPPDEPAPRALSAEEVQQEITSHLKSEPGLSNTEIVAHVNKRSVVLSGKVSSEQQRDLALGIARSYAGHRKLVDKIKVQRQS
jgi:hypothetical protein